ncbi:MAG: penicillin-binding protein 2 [Nitrospirae bacterium]|nr:penicillin-binding protein 2 [Nitrospirota bacterium]
MGRPPVTSPPPPSRGPGIQRRIQILAMIGGGVFLLLLFQIWHLQIIQGKHYRQLSENNRLRVVTIAPHRGLVYDRHGEVLARNVPSFSLGLVKEDVSDLPGTLEKLAPLVGMSPEEMTQRIRATKQASPFTPWILKERLTLDEMARVKGRQWELPGVVIEVETLREYPHGPLAAHLLGYVGEISQAQLESPAFAGEIPGRIVGQYGVEKSYDDVLRGVPGRKEIEVDAMGRERRTLRTESPVPGNGVVLSIDLAVQKSAEEALGERAGVVVAMDPRTGEVLSLVSHPAFDPNLLSGRLTWEVWRGIQNDPGYPLTNRAVQGQFPPGSVFKIVMALGGMEKGFVEPSRKLLCTGSQPLGRRIFHDWKKEGHGTVDLHRAIVESCDVYFYQLGNRMGVDAIAEVASGMGMGEPTGIDLPSEKRGLVPSTAWKQKAKGDRWYAGETLPVAIGQGYLLVTPVQQAVLMATVANSGVRVRPRVVRGIVEEGRYFGFPRVEAGRVPLSPEAVRTVMTALRGVVHEPHGTGSAARSAVVEIGGKTGTAQVVGRLAASESETPYRFRDHAWFVAFAPVEAPRIVVAVLVEHGGHGGSVAAPVAKQVIESYLAGGAS